MDINKTIKRNLFFKVDFDGRYKKTKKGVVQEVKFYLVGSVPVVIEYEDESKERSIINIPVEVKQDPYLRLMHGAKYEHLKDVKKAIKEKFKLDVDYRKEADEVVGKAQKAIRQVIDKGEFMGKKIKSLLIINIGKQEYEQTKNNTKKG